MRPSRSFLLLLIFLVCFTGFHYILPKKHLFPSVNDFISSDLEGFFRKDTLVKDTPVLSIPDSGKVDIPSDSIIQDSLFSSDSTLTDTLSYAEEPLQVFIDSLLSPGKQTRVIYYGDSQIEGDRMTYWLRQSLRSVSGGTGPGLMLPVMPVMYTKTLWVRSSANWKRYNYLSYRNDEISHRKFGPFMAVCRYMPESSRSDRPEKAFVRIRASKAADSTSSVYEKLRIFYRNIEGHVGISISGDEKLIAVDSLKTDDNLNEFSCMLGDPDEVLIEFTGAVSPDIYGISIESSSGVLVDNIPQRGSAGLEFTMVDRNDLNESYNLLQPDLFILHYGLNIVRNVRSDYSYYSKGLARQLALLREVAPGTPVLVIGLTDMASREGDSLRSYPNIPAIIGAQKQASEAAGVLFWDAWRAMGGSASIIRWSEKDPPLAQKDLVHLTYAGADTLSKMMADSLFLRHIYLIEHTAEDQDTAEVMAALTSEPVTIPVAEEKEVFGKRLLSELLSYDPSNPLIFPVPAFWLFMLIVLAGYSLVYKRLFLRNFYLFLVSLFFYYKSGGLFLFLLIFVTIIDFTAGLIIGGTGKRWVRKIFIVISIASNIGILAYFKYTGFIAGAVNHIFGTDIVVHDYLAGFSNLHLGTSFDISNILLPVGISFFTFQSLSYTMDVYRRKIEPVRNLIDFGFYVSFFPQLVAGPIVRASEFIPQLYMKYNLEKREFSHALFLICKGLVKKIIISDFISVNFVDRVFDTPSIYSGFENLMAIYGYGLQIYCDFSGYTDIAIGVGLILGFRLPLNFNSPYKAAGLSDFWKRWHISLSRWLKDYLYIPLGGNRKGKFRTNINLLVTMLLGGLWHGADLRFLIWGFLHGIGLVFERIFRKIFGDRLRLSRPGRFLVILITFHFVSFCWIFFRAPDLESVRIMLAQITGNFSPGTWSVVMIAYSSVFLLIAAGYVVHFLPEDLKESYRGMFIRVPVPVQMAIIMVIAVLLFQMRATDTMPFIYFRF